MTKPFAGVRILDFTQVFAGPFGCYQLALLGADGQVALFKTPLDRPAARGDLDGSP